MALKTILLLSIIFQVTAALLAINMITVTGRRLGWILIAFTAVLMSLRRTVVFFETLAGDAPQTISLVSESTALAVSLLMVLGILRIGPVFRSIKTSAQALRESEEKQRNILESIDEGYFEIDLYGNFRFISDWFSHETGYTREELLSMGYRDGVTPDSGRELLKVFNHVHDTGRPAKKIDYEIITKTGEKKHHQLSASLVKDPKGRPMGFRGVARDITENKQSQEALRQSEELYRLVAENTSDVIWLLDLGTQSFTYISPSIYNINGYTPEEAKNRKFEEQMTPESHQLVLDTLLEHLAREERGEVRPGEKIVLEVEELHKDGHNIWVASSMSLLRDENNKPIGIVGVARDITENKKAGEVLKRSEERYRTILESIEEGYFEVDLDGSFVYVSDWLCSIFGGRSKEELLGSRAIEYVASESRKAVREAFDITYRTGKPAKKINYEFAGAEDIPKRHEMSASLMLDADGAPVGYRGVIRDITELWLAQEALKVSEARYRLLFEHAPTGIYEIDFQKRKFVSANDLICEYTGYSKKELLSMNPLDMLAPESVPVFLNRLTKILAGEPVSHNPELKIVCKDGREYWVMLDVSFIYEAGRARGATVVVHDITERRLSEELIKTSLRDKEVLLKEIHHRVKNNMQVVSSLINLQAAKISDEKILSLFRESQSRVSAMALIHELLYQSESMAGIDLGLYVKRLTDALAVAYQNNGRNVSIQIDADGIELGMDQAVPCGLAINELVSNSFKYAFSEKSQGQINISARRVYNMDVELIVSDNGAGFPEDADWRGLDSLGLSLVIGLVENQLGGRLELIREQGTMFRMVFGMAGGETGEERGVKPRILIVEDEYIVAADIMNRVEKMGYSALHVDSGESALEAVGNFKPELVLMDVSLSGEIDGVETAGRLTANGCPPVIFLSAFSGDMDDLDLGDGITRDCLKKPFNDKELKSAIEKVLG